MTEATEKDGGSIALPCFAWVEIMKVENRPRKSLNSRQFPLACKRTNMIFVNINLYLSKNTHEAYVQGNIH